MTPTETRGTEPRETRSGAVVWLLSIIAAASAIGLLYYGKSLLAPLAIALLIYVLMTALLKRLGHVTLFGRAVPRWLAYLIVFGLFGGVAVLIANVIAGQVDAFSSAAPRYIARFEQVASDLGRFLGPELMASVNDAIAQANVGQAVARVVQGAGATLGATSLVILFLAFLLVDTGSLQYKLPHLVPDRENREKVSAALAAMSASLQSYMGIKTFVSLLTGGLAYLVMKPVGLDFAETWAFIILLLNFIPTIGSIIGTVLPTIAALAQFTDAGPILVILGGIGAVQFVIGNIVEPTLSSRTLNLSPFAMIFSLLFWSTIWGVPGAFLGAPLTVCIAIICSHVQTLRPFAILLASSIPPADQAETRQPKQPDQIAHEPAKPS